MGEPEESDRSVGREDSRISTALSAGKFELGFLSEAAWTDLLSFDPLARGI